MIGYGNKQGRVDSGGPGGEEQRVIDKRQVVPKGKFE